MRSKAKTVAEYIASLPEDRRGAIKAVRDVVMKHLPAGYKEGMEYGYISWSVPLSLYPETYNGQPLCYAALASQKNHMALYLMCAYADSPIKQRLVKGFKDAKKKLDMGKSCVRFQSLDDVALDVIAEMFRRLPAKRYIETYTNALAASGRGLDGKKIAAAAKKAARKAPKGTAPKAATKRA